ncbi:MAG: phosphoheptose isomerase [Deltaproteobacteria bacterium]|nr:phosphoheptose isomerase [Deltaproteobacteria bacterium]
MKDANYNYFSQYFENISNSLKSIDTINLSEAAKLIWDTHVSGKKIILVGNGGSAAMASHVAVDLTKAAGIRAINFNEADLITCFANDYGYEYWVEKALEAYADQGDLAIMISSSGQSANMLNGTAKAKKMGMSVITVSGFLSNNPLRELGNVNLWLNSTEYNIVEMTHHIWLLAIIDLLIETKNLNK